MTHPEPHTLTWRDLDWGADPDEVCDAFTRLLRDAALFAGTPTWTRVRTAPAGEPGDWATLRRTCGTEPNPQGLASLDENPAEAFRTWKSFGKLRWLNPSDTGPGGRWAEEDRGPDGAWFGWRAARGGGFIVKAYDPTLWPCGRGEPAAVLMAAIVGVAAERAGRRVTPTVSDRNGERRAAPLHYDPTAAQHCDGAGWVVDIRRAYLQLSAPMGWDLRYERGGVFALGSHPFWGCEVWAKDKWLAHRIIGITEAGAYAAPDLRNWRMDCLHAIATAAVTDHGAVYWNTDGGVFEHQAAAEAFAGYLTEVWGLRTKTEPNAWERRSKELLDNPSSNLRLDDIDVELLTEGRRYALDQPADTADQLPPLAPKDDPDQPHPRTGEWRQLRVIDVATRRSVTHTVHTWREDAELGEPGPRLAGDPSLAATTPLERRHGLGRVSGAVTALERRRWGDSGESGWAVTLAPGSFAGGTLDTSAGVFLRHLTDRPTVAVGDHLDELLVPVADQIRPSDPNDPKLTRYLPPTGNPAPALGGPFDDDDKDGEMTTELPDDYWTTEGTELAFSGIARWDSDFSDEWLRKPQGTTADGAPVPAVGYLAWWGADLRTGEQIKQPGKNPPLPMRITDPDRLAAIKTFLANRNPDHQVRLVYHQHEGLAGLNKGITRVVVGFDDPAWPPRPSERPATAPASSPSPAGHADGLDARVARLETELAQERALVDRLAGLLLAHIDATGHSPMSLALSAGDHVAVVADLRARSRFTNPDNR